MSDIMNARVILRNDTAAAWTAINPILRAGEMGIESDTGKFKLGDGASAWTALEYALSDALAGKAAASHDHDQADVTGLADALAGKAAADHDHDQADVTGLADALAGKAAADHDHAQADVTGLTDALAMRPTAVDAMPEAAESRLGEAVVYTGASDGTYNQGAVYVCAAVEGGYAWATAAYDASGKIDKVPNAVAGKVAVFGEDGGLVEGDQTLANLSTSSHMHYMYSIRGLVDWYNARVLKVTDATAGHLVSFAEGGGLADNGVSVAANVTLADDADAAGVKTALAALLAALKTAGLMAADA